MQANQGYNYAQDIISNQGGELFTIVLKFIYQNYYYNLIIKNIQMKHIDLQTIMQRRKNIKIKQQLIAQPSQTKPLKTIPLKQINDVTIDNIIKKSIDKKSTLNNDNKLQILQIIYQKTGIHFNKKIILEKMTIKYCQYIRELDNIYHRSNRSYFILKGQAMIYQQKQKQKQKNQLKFNTQPIQDQDQQIYIKIDDFLQYNTQFKLIAEYKEYRGFGPLFQSNHNNSVNHQKRKKLIAIDAVVVCFQEINLQFQQLFNDGLGNDQKLQILTHFPILKLMGKKLHSFINNFKIKRFTLKDYIYKQGQTPQAVYFIVKGQIGFQLILQQQNNNNNHNKINKNVINNDVIGDFNYFGEEEIILRTDRINTAKVTSSKCMVLQIQRQKFVKFMQNSQFSEVINRCLKDRILKRQQKLAKLRNIIKIQTQKKQNKLSQRLTQQQVKKLIVHDKIESKRKFSLRNKNHAKTKIMHGNLIRQFQDDKQEINFSMLKVNPDMYDAVKKNYRIYDVKPLNYDKPTVKDFKKIWNILNLEEIIRQEEINISGPEGRRYYDSHRRLMAHVNQSKSIRPKTSSSNYRTKLQYIAYLQQFNN